MANDTITITPSSVISALEAGIALVAPGSSIGTQLGTLLSLTVSALPAIEAGVASAEPFIQSFVNLILSGGKPIPADEWATQIANLKAQVSALDAEVAADGD